MVKRFEPVSWMSALPKYLVQGFLPVVPVRLLLT
jgi:hypothetical protein